MGGDGVHFKAKPLERPFIKQWSAKTLTWSQTFVGSDPYSAVDWLCDLRKCKKLPGDFFKKIDLQ